MFKANSGSKRFVFGSSSRTSTTSKFNRSLVNWRMFAFNRSMRSLTGMETSSSGFRSANSMPARWIAASFCC